jgi:hypothetical protein
MLKRDSIGFGVLVGVVLPGILLLILLGLGRLTEPGAFISRPFEGFKPILASLVINLVTMRIYFVNFKMDRTGRGILLATFIIGAVFFLLYKYL